MKRFKELLLEVIVTNPYLENLLLEGPGAQWKHAAAAEERRRRLQSSSSRQLSQGYKKRIVDNRHIKKLEVKKNSDGTLPDIKNIPGTYETESKEPHSIMTKRDKDQRYIHRSPELDRPFHVRFIHAISNGKGGVSHHEVSETIDGDRFPIFRIRKKSKAENYGHEGERKLAKEYQRYGLVYRGTLSAGSGAGVDIQSIRRSVITLSDGSIRQTHTPINNEIKTPGHVFGQLTLRGGIGGEFEIPDKISNNPTHQHYQHAKSLAAATYGAGENEKLMMDHIKNFYGKSNSPDDVIRRKDRLSHQKSNPIGLEEIHDFLAEKSDFIHIIESDDMTRTYTLNKTLHKELLAAGVPSQLFHDPDRKAENIPKAFITTRVKNKSSTAKVAPPQAQWSTDKPLTDGVVNDPEYRKKLAKFSGVWEGSIAHKEEGAEKARKKEKTN